MKSQPMADSFSVSRAAEDLVVLLDHLGFDKAVLVGHSMGGYISQELLLHHPERVRALVTIGSTCLTLKHPKIIGWGMRLSPQLLRLVPYQAFVSWTARYITVTAAGKDYVRQVVGGHTKSEFIEVWSAVMNCLHDEPDYQISQPVLITYGEQDRLGFGVMKQQAQAWAQRDPNARCVPVPAAGHNAQQENPRVFNKVLLDFLNRHIPYQLSQTEEMKLRMSRIDNRANNQLRPVRFTPDFTNYAEGSVLVETGQTRILCNVSLEEKVPAWREDSGAGWLTAEYGMLPRSTHQRIPRHRGSESARSQEIRRLIGRALRAAVDLDKLGPRTLTVDCDVIQADGGTRTAGITGGYVAVALALHKLIKAGKVPADVLVTPVAAVSVGVVDRAFLLDLCYEEDAAAEVDFNVVMTGTGKFIEIQGTAEGEPFDQTTLIGLIDLARAGVEELLAAQAALLAKLNDN